MMTGSHNWADRLYARFLTLYPRHFRDEYSESLQQLFHDLRDDPTMPRWRIWLGVLADIPGSVIPEHLVHAKEGTAMALTARWMQYASVRVGIAVGLVLGLVHLVYNMVNNAFNLDGQGYALLNNGLTIALVLCFAVAGFVGARRAGTVQAGTTAGIMAACVSSVIGIVTLWLATWLFFAQIHQNTGMIEDFRRSGGQSMDAFIIEDAFGASAFGPLFAFVLATLLGTLGGFLAKLTFRLRTR